MSFLLFWQTFRKLMSHSELKLKRKKCWTFTWATIGRLWCLIMSHRCLRWLVSFMLVIRKRLNLKFFIEEKIEKHWKNYLYMRHNRKEEALKDRGFSTRGNYHNSLTLLSVISHSNYPAISYFYLLILAIICSFCDRNEQHLQIFYSFSKAVFFRVDYFYVLNIT